MTKPTIPMVTPDPPSNAAHPLRCGSPPRGITHSRLVRASRLRILTIRTQALRGRAGGSGASKISYFGKRSRSSTATTFPKASTIRAARVRIATSGHAAF